MSQTTPYGRWGLVGRAFWIELAMWRRGKKEWRWEWTKCRPVGIRVRTPLVNAALCLDLGAP